jgi:hypothetical protein
MRFCDYHLIITNWGAFPETFYRLCLVIFPTWFIRLALMQQQLDFNFLFFIENELLICDCPTIPLLKDPAQARKKTFCEWPHLSSVHRKVSFEVRSFKATTQCLVSIKNINSAILFWPNFFRGLLKTKDTQMLVKIYNTQFQCCFYPEIYSIFFILDRNLH